MAIEFKEVNGHIEVYADGKFLFSADTTQEAVHDLDEMIA